MNLIKKIAVIGPESTGKSTLCQQLAEHYQTLWVPEFAREYLEKNSTDYSYEDLLIIAKGQVASEERYTNDKIKSQKSKVKKPSQLSAQSLPINIHYPVLIIDTEMYVMKVWCEFVFDKCHNWILSQIAERKYDCYLLCNVDLPWVKDNLREYPDKHTRTKLYCYYKDIMINQATPWIDINGDYQERLTKAINGIDSIIS